MTTNIFEAERHCKVQAEPWNEAAVQAAIQEILQKALEDFSDPEVWFPKEAKHYPTKNLYTGSAGVLWALDALGASSLLQPTKEELIHRIYRAYLEHPDEEMYPASYFLGESGILTLLLKWTTSLPYQERLLQLLRFNVSNEAVELFWGSSGTMMAALHLFRATQEEHWLSVYQEGAALLLDTCLYVEDRDLWYWPSKESLYIGAAHGTAGCFLALLAGFELFSQKLQEGILERLVQSFLSLATWEGGLANWQATIAGLGSTQYLVQWCHGAPGIISSLSLVPLGFSPSFDALLTSAGELIWYAGPLEKGVNLCHGTSGNGYALLALFARTKDPKWLVRARAFAMMALTQRRQANASLQNQESLLRWSPKGLRESLWTGEIGLACFLDACLREKSDLPALQLF